MGVQQYSSVNKLGSVRLGEEYVNSCSDIGIDHHHNIDLPDSVAPKCFSCSEIGRNIREEFDHKILFFHCINLLQRG